MSDPIPVHPVQRKYQLQRDQAVVPQVVSRLAYEVYCEVWSPQEAIITGDCRGGFGIGELIGYLYAHNFPKKEWRARYEEAINGMLHL